MRPEVAHRRIESFAKRFGEAHLDLCYHGAFPLALTPNLLYCLWANFKRDIHGERLEIPWVAVADLLLSPLCEEVGKELYEMHGAVRNLLLDRLKEDPRFGEKRINDLSEFLLAYVEQQLRSDDPDVRDFAEAQKWTALAYVEPSKAARELAFALRKAYQEDKTELVRVASMVETFAEPLAGFEPLLVYARGMKNCAHDDWEGATEEFDKVSGGDREFQVAGINLPIPDHIFAKTSGTQVTQVFSIPGRTPTAAAVIEYPTTKNIRSRSNFMRASKRGLEIVDRARKINRWNKDAEAWCDAAFVSRSTLMRFWYKSPIRRENFISICKAVGIDNWEDIVERDEAIKKISEAGQVDNAQQSAQDWAMTQLNLGKAYINRIEGDKAENIETAIDAFQQALQIYTQSTFPQEWVMTQNNLGIAYCERIKGNRAENIENALAAYSLALQVYTWSTFPQDWAMTQNNIGSAYLQRVKGDKAENIEQALSAYWQALQVYTQSAFPKNWAMTQNNIGNAYFQRIKGDRTENIEQALAAYSLALQVYTRSIFPQDWATTQTNIGNAYVHRIKGDKAENIEQALAAYSLALQVYTRSTFPQDWAMTQTNIGNAYFQRIKGDKVENIEQALAAYHAALQVYTREAFPQQWAKIQNNLGDAYQNRILGDRSENIERAISCHQAALTVISDF